MIAPNPNAMEQADSEEFDLDTRVDISITFRSYVHAEREFHRTSKRFTEACRELRQKLPRGRRFVIRHDMTHYLVESDNDGNFDIEKIESL